MRWRESFLTEVASRLGQLGLQSCPMCTSGVIGAHRLPVFVLYGAMPPEASIAADPDAQMDLMVRAECQLCGYTMFFNAEKFRIGDAPVLIEGWTDEAERAAAAADDPF